MAKTRAKNKNIRTKASEPSRKKAFLPANAVRAFPGLPVLIGIIFFAVTLCGSWALKYDAKLLFVLASGFLFLFTFFNGKNRSCLISEADPVFFILLAHTLLYFAGLFYASFPKLALSEFFLNAGGFFIFAVCRISFTRDKKNINQLFAVLAVAICVLCLICIELATSGLLLPLIRRLSGLVGTPVPGNYAGFESNTRITTIITNPNIFAAIAGIGIFLSLSVRMNATVPALRIGYMGIGIVCGTAFVLCFSMGAILAFLVSFAVFCLLAEKNTRKAFILPAIYLLFVSFLGAAAVFACLEQGILPLLFVIVLSAGASALTLPGLIRLPGVRIGKKMKRIAALVCAFIVLLLMFAALTVKAPYTFGHGDELRRVIYLKPGEYTLQVGLSDPESAISAEIRSMNYTQAALKESTVLLNTALRPDNLVPFTVPESSAAVFFRFNADAKLQIESAFVQNGSGFKKQLSLKYVFIPEFIVNRLQGIWVNDNAAQRFVFFRDGIRLGMKSPIFGHGGGAFEGAARSVADYYYETAHTHSQYIQSFADGGVIGLILFTALTLYLLSGLYKAKKSGRKPAFIGAALTMIIFHCALEVDFMHPAFRMLASVIFAAAAASFSYRFKLQKPVGKPAAYCAFALCVVTLALACGRIWAVNAFTSKSLKLKTLQTAAVLDPFNDVDYKLSYLMSALYLGDSISIQSKADAYLESMVNDKMIPGTAYHLVSYYLQMPNPDIEKAADMAERYIRGERVNPQAWDAMLSLYRSAMENTAGEDETALSDAIMRLASYLAQLNSELPKTIKPDLMLQEYLWAQMQSAPGEAVDILSMNAELYGSGADIRTKTGDGLFTCLIPVIARPGESYIVKVYQDENLPCEISVNGILQPISYDKGEGCYVPDRIFSAYDFELSVIAADLPDVRITIASCDSMVMD